MSYSQEASSVVWFMLVESQGCNYELAGADKLSLRPISDVANFRKQVKAKHPNKLSSLDPADLIIYKNKDAFHGKEEPLREDFAISGLGTSEKDALVVFASSSAAVDESSQSHQEQCKKPDVNNIHKEKMPEKLKEKPTTLQRLIDEPKGKTTYTAGEPFLLHVFWEAPSVSAAKELLDALLQCAEATHRDAPCVPTYFFRISSNDESLYGEAPKLVGEHKQLAAAIKKVNVGIPRAAVSAELIRSGLDPKYLDLDASADLPTPLQGQKPVAVEFTEVYLDERAFMEHAGSRDYLKGYGVVMSPALTNSPPITLRFGTPRESMVEKILEPILKERVVSLAPGYTVWQCPSEVTDCAFLISIDTWTSTSPPCLSGNFQQNCVWSVYFPHPHRDGISRFMAVFPSLPPEAVLHEIASLHPIRGEAHTKGGEEASNQVREAFQASGLELVVINANSAVGYVLHNKAAELHPE